MSGLVVSQPPFPFQVWQTWSETKTLESFSILSPAHAFTSPRELFFLAVPFLLGICLPLLWGLPFPSHVPLLLITRPLPRDGGVEPQSSCSHSDLPLVKVRLLLTLTLSPLMIWYSGQTPLFFFAKVAPAFLPTALSVALRPLFPFQYAQVFPLKPAAFCTLFAALGSTNKSATSPI